MIRKLLCRRQILCCICLGVGIVYGTACQRSNTPPPGVILVVLDAARADHFSVYGYDERTTPRIDAIAREAVWYRRAYSIADFTMASILSLLMGQYTAMAHWPEIGTWEWPFMLPQLLRKRGVETGWFTQSYLNPQNGFFIPFDYTFALEFRSQPDPFPLVQKAVQWIRSRRRPYFVYIHILPPHAPRVPPLRYAPPLRNGRPPRVDSAIWLTTRTPLPDPSARLKGLQYWYDASLRWADAAVGWLYDALQRTGHLRNTWLIITADHGEALGEYQLFFHARDVYEPFIHVPLIVRAPEVLSVPPGPRSTLVTVQDLYPTILEIFRVPVPFSSPFRSMVASFFHPDVAVRQEVISCTVGYLACAWIRGRLKVIVRARHMQITPPLDTRPRVELYRLPDERPLESNRAVFEPKNALALAAPLYNWIATRKWHRDTATVSELLKQLQALGYVRAAFFKLHVRFRLVPTWLPFDRLRARVQGVTGFSLEYEPARPVVILRVTNQSPFAWPSQNWQDQGGVVLFTTWVRPDNQKVQGSSRLVEDLLPNQTQDLPIQIPEALTPGRWQLRVAVGQQGRPETVPIVDHYPVTVPEMLTRIGNGWWRLRGDRFVLGHRAYWFFYFPAKRRPCLDIRLRVRAFGRTVPWEVNTSEDEPVWKGEISGERWQDVVLRLRERDRVAWTVLVMQSLGGEKIAAEVFPELPPTMELSSVLSVQLRTPEIIYCDGRRVTPIDALAWRSPEKKIP